MDTSWRVVLPDVPGIAAGDQVFVAQQLWSSVGKDRWKLRWSMEGGTRTAEAWDDVGDFTVEIPLAVTPCYLQNCWEVVRWSSAG